MIKCPLKIRFGKDVANLIYHFVWKSMIANVNDEYKAEFIYNNELGSVKRIGTFFAYNFRSDRGDGYINNYQMFVDWINFGIIALLPFHYNP